MGSYEVVYVDLILTGGGGAYFYEDVILAILCSHMQEWVPAHVDGVCTGPSMKKHVHDLGVSVHRGVVEWRKAMLITALYKKDEVPQ